MSTSLFFRSAIVALISAILLGSGCTKEIRKNRLLARSQSDFDAGSYDKAEVEYNGARQLAPLDSVAIRQLGILYYNEGRLTHAYAFLKKAVELDQKDMQAQLNLGQAAFSLGAIKEARTAAKVVLASEPSNEEAILLLTKASRTRADADETSQLVENLRQTNKDCAAYHLALERMLLLHSDLVGAEREERIALTLDPKSSAAYEDLGDLFLLKHDAKQAGQAYQTAARLAPLRSVMRLQDIDFRIRTGDAAAGKKDLEALSQAAPDYIPAWIFTMKLAFAERRFADCAAAIQTILFRDPGNYDAMAERGILKLAQNDVPGAVEQLKAAEEIYPRVPQIKYELALAYARSGDIIRATDRLNQAILLAPNFNEAILLLADLNGRKGNSSGAIASLNPLLARAPQFRQAYLLLAHSYLNEKNTVLALSTYQRMAAAFPKDPEPLYRGGMILAQSGQLKQAREAFEKAVQVAPSYAAALDMLVRLDLAEKQPSAATARVQNLIAKYPKSGGPWLLKSEIDLAARRADDAASDLHQAIELEPKLQQAYFNLARLYMASHKTKEAIDQLAALVDETKSLNAEMEIAAIHTELGQFDVAAADYHKLLSIDPKYVPALNNLAIIDGENLGRLDEAYQIGRQAREAAPDEASVADTLGWILFKRGDLHGALELLQESAGRAPEDTVVQYHMGMAHYMLGEEDPARVAFERAAGAEAATAIKDQAKSRLGVLAVDPETAGPEARADLEKRAAADPKDPIVAGRLAALLARDGAAAEAAAGFENALKLAPNNPRTMLGLAQLYAGPLHDPVKARALAKAAHELIPDDPHTAETLGRLLYRTGDYQWSVDLLEEAARGLPHQPDLMYDLALGYYSVGRISDAAQALQEARSGSGNFSRRPDADRLAAMLAAASSPASAEAAAGMAGVILAQDPNYLPALMVAGLAREEENDPTGAAAFYERILAQDELFAPATRQLARIYVQRTGGDEKTFNLAVKARAAFPTDPDVATTLGIVNYRRGDYGAAARLFRESLQRRPDEAETEYYLGMSHYNLRDLEESKAELQHAIDLRLSEREADDAQHTLDEMKGDAQGPALSSQPIN